jgi:predicted Zn-dependent protease
MRIRSGILTGFLIIIFVSSACNRKVVPSLGKVKQGKEFDSATYNYVYVEAIKEKLLGNSGDALRYLEHCTKLNPKSDAVYYQMAQIVAANGDLNRGKKYLVKALAIQPRNMWYLMMMSSLCYQTNSIDSALMYYERAANYYPDNDDLQMALGKLYSETKRYDKAITIFNGLDSKYGINETSTVMAVKDMIAAGRFKDAEEKTLSLLKDKPDEILYNGLLAEVYQGEGKKEQAMEVYDVLIKRNPDNPMIQVSLCNFLIDTKKYDELFLLLNTITVNSNIKIEDKVTLFAKMVESEDFVKTEGTRLQIALMVLEANYEQNQIIPLLRVDLMVKKKDLDGAAVRLEDIISKEAQNYYAWEKLLLVYLEEKDFADLEKKGQ